MKGNGDYTVKKTLGGKLTPEQLKRLIVLAKQLDKAEAGYEGAYGLKPKRFDDENLQKWIPTQTAYTAHKDGKTVGMALASPSSKFYDNMDYVSHVVVDPAHQGKGVGRALLRRAILDSARAKRQISLRVNANNPAGLHLYESMGFQPFSHAMVYRGKKKDGLASKVASVLRKAAAPVAATALATSPTVARGAYPGSLNNPGNMRDYGIKWKGAVRPGSNRGGFIRFDTPQNGARAVSRNLLTLGTKRGIPFTLNDVMAKYSPKTENNLSRHVRNISAISNLPPDKVLDPKNTGQMVDLLRGVIGAESGQKALNWFRPVELTNAVLRARQP